MNDDLKKVFSLAVCIFMAAIAIYGSYMPYKKSSLYIDAIRTLQGGRIDSLLAFQNALNPALNAPGPIGQNELVRNSSNYVVSLIRGNGAAHPEVVPILLEYLNQYYKPILAVPQGMSYGQDLLLVGSAYESAYIATKDEKYLDQAIFYIEKAREMGPKRPQPLYTLFDLYRLKNENDKARQVGEQILSQWPADTKVGPLLKALGK